ncbi:MAG TPA: prenyltransferase [Thermoanaerobaculaceae bacterium]|nr:prenyltransferase [Thermoanaerobaculaceae bacterium]
MSDASANRLALALRLGRAHYTPIVVGGALSGGMYELWRTGAIRWGNMALAVVGAFFAHVAANVVNDVYDFGSGVDTAAPTRESPDFGGSDVLTKGLMTPREASLWGGAFAVAALGLGAVIAVSAGWGVFVPALLGAFLAFQYVAPPLRFGYLGHGLGELAILIAFGPLTVAGAAWAVVGHWDWGAAAVGSFVGVNIVGILYCHHFTHFEADRTAGKMSPVAVLGAAAGLRLAWLLPVLSAASLVALVSARALPWPALVGLLAPAMQAGALAKASPDAGMEGFGNLTRAVAGAATVGGGALALALALAHWLGR